jgi:sulfite exporter TauE/SafE
MARWHGAARPGLTRAKLNFEQGQLTGLPILRVALPFFTGRATSYAILIMIGAAAGRRWHVDSLESIFYASGWFIASQVLLLGALYAFARVDWQALFDQHKFAWLHK